MLHLKQAASCFVRPCHPLSTSAAWIAVCRLQFLDTLKSFPRPPKARILGFILRAKHLFSFVGLHLHAVIVPAPRNMIYSIPRSRNVAFNGALRMARVSPGCSEGFWKQSKRFSASPTCGVNPGIRSHVNRKASMLETDQRRWLNGPSRHRVQMHSC